MAAAPLKKKEQVMLRIPRDMSLRWKILSLVGILLTSMTLISAFAYTSTTANEAAGRA